MDERTQHEIGSDMNYLIGCDDRQVGEGDARYGGRDEDCSGKENCRQLIPDKSMTSKELPHFCSSRFRAPERSSRISIAMTDRRPRREAAMSPASPWTNTPE